MTVRYRHHDGLRLVTGPAPLASTPGVDGIALCERTLELLRRADGAQLSELVGEVGPSGVERDGVRAALACFAEAGLLIRDADAVPHPVRAPDRDPGPGTAGVSVVIIGYNGRHWLERLLPTVEAQTHRALETIVVDNGSSDGTTDWLQQNAPDVRVLRIDPAVSFATAVNRGVDASNGDHVLLLNQDLELAPDLLAGLRCRADAAVRCAAVAAKLRLLRMPPFLNGIGNRVDDHSWGTDNGVGQLDLGHLDDLDEVPSACFAAALLSREAWQQIGGIDEGFPMYYEDAEWCHRARALGWTILAEPDAVAYHAFGGSSESGGAGLEARKLEWVTYGRLRFTHKLVPEPARGRYLDNYRREDRATIRSALRESNLAEAHAVWRAHRQLGRSREQIQASRATLGIGPREWFDHVERLGRAMPRAVLHAGRPSLRWSDILATYRPLFGDERTRAVPEFEQRHRPPVVTVVSNDVVDHRMAGPGMRYVELARHLGSELDVRLAIPNTTDLELDGVELVTYDSGQPETVRVLVDNSDVALVTGYLPARLAGLLETETRLVVDLYNPFMLENLFYYQDAPIEDQDRLNEGAVEVANRLAELGDFFICGNERQRDFWMGLLVANGRATPSVFAHDPELRELIDVVGMGIPSRPPSGAPLLRGRHEAVPANARIVLWGGGIWNWLDPLTLVRAWPSVASRHPDARLVLLGTRHPNPEVPEHQMAARAMELARDTGELDRTILCIDWVPYTDRERLLAESAVSVTLHPVHAETRYSLRTRVLDAIWARLPLVITEGDWTSEWIREHHVGVAVAPHDIGAVTAALDEVLTADPARWATGFDALHAELQWSRVVEPLRRYCLEGHRWSRRAPAASPASIYNWPLYVLATQGPRVALDKVWKRLTGRGPRPS